MKKRFFCILALLLALTLCACGGATADNSSSSDEVNTPTAPTILSENADGETVVLEYDLAVQMTLQSDFTLYLDGDMNLVAIEAADEDGRNLLSGLDIAGKPYAGGMGLVLNAAYEQGILADQGKVYFTVTCDDISMVLMETLFAPVMQFEQDNGVFIFLDWDVISEEEPDFEANYLYGLQKFEEDDQTIYMEKAQWIHPTAGGQTVYSFFSKFPDPSVYDLGSLLIGSNLDQIRIKMLYFNEDGSTSATYFEDGFQTKSVICRDSKIELYEYADRAQTNWSYKDETGSYSFFEYENGINVRSFGFWTDGTQGAQITYTYHSNGNVAIEEEIGSDGSYSQRTYDENGNAIYTYLISKSPDGTYTEAEFENGQEVYQKTVYPDGTYMEGRIENGNWTWTEGTIEPTDPANE